MSNGKGIHLNGDKKWLEQILNEKFGRIEDKIDGVNQCLQRHQNDLDFHSRQIQELKDEKDDCRANIISKMEHILGKEEGMNFMAKKNIDKKELNIKYYTIVLASINVAIVIIVNIVFKLLSS